YVRDPATGRHEKFPQVGRLEIEDDAEIGANTTIDRGALDTTRIGRGTKIDNLVHIGHNCQIREDVVIAAQTGLSRSITIETSVVAGLTAALPEYHWTALKITQYGHGVCSRDGQACHCATDDHSWAISEEKDRSGESDTSRFLVAGAVRAWWVRTEQGRLAEAMPTIRRSISEAENMILESNSVLKFVRPDLYLTVLDPATADFKRSAQEFLDQANAVILH